MNTIANASVQERPGATLQMLATLAALREIDGRVRTTVRTGSENATPQAS